MISPTTYSPGELVRRMEEAKRMEEQEVIKPCPNCRTGHMVVVRDRRDLMQCDNCELQEKR